MDIDKVNLNELPNMVVKIFEKLEKIELTIEKQAKQSTPKEETHVLLSTEEASTLLKMPMATLYAKLADGSIPGYKPGKRWVINKDELIKWLENYRINDSVDSDNEINENISNSQKRKPKQFNI